MDEERGRVERVGGSVHYRRVSEGRYGGSEASEGGTDERGSVSVGEGGSMKREVGSVERKEEMIPGVL